MHCFFDGVFGTSHRFYELNLTFILVFDFEKLTIAKPVVCKLTFAWVTKTPDPSKLSTIAFTSGKLFAYYKAAFNKLPHLVRTGWGRQPIVANLACLVLFLTVTNLTIAISWLTSSKWGLAFIAQLCNKCATHVTWSSLGYRDFEYYTCFHLALTIAPQSFDCARNGKQYYRAKIGRHCKINLIICKLYQTYQNYHFFSPVLKINFD